MNKATFVAAAGHARAGEKALARAAVLGATGYTGQELLRLLMGHPRFEVVAATSESEAGQRVPGSQMRYVPMADVDVSAVDVVFGCLPHGESGGMARRAAAAGALAIDLSSDLRAPDSGAVYGLPELWRSEIAQARLIANPGCYPTGVLLGLAPALSAGLLDDTRPLIIDAASGVSGAGRSPKRDLLFAEVAEDYKAYGVGNTHRHVPEMRVGMTRLSGGKAQFIFTPHLLAVKRGILETMYVPLKTGITVADATRLWDDFYVGEPFVEVTGAALPSLKQVVGSNLVSIGFSEVADVDVPTLIVVVAFDNLVKGASGQALQNANIALGFEETLGLVA